MPLRDNPDVEVALRNGPRRPMRATVLAADGRAGVWPELAARHTMYAAYRRRTDREIPFVWLEPH